jgi:Tol biopolymer transport system component
VSVNEELVGEVIHLGRTSQSRDNVTWSPDGQLVAFLKGYVAEFTEEQQEATSTSRTLVTDLWLAHADGSDPRQLTYPDRGKGLESFESGPSHAMSPCWAPVGKALAYASGFGCGGRLAVLDVATGQSKTLPYGVPIGSGIRWSPDGEWLAFWGTDWKTFAARMTPGDFPPCALAVVRADGTGFRRAAEAESGCVCEWSPDGRQLLYAQRESVEAPRALWIVKPDGSAARQLAPSIAVGGRGSWSPDGEWVAYPGDDDAPGLWIVNVATLERQQVAQEPVSCVRWGRGGPGIWHVENHDLYLLGEPDRRSQQVTTSGNVVSAGPSPTGTHVAVAVREKPSEEKIIGRADMYVLKLK